MRDCWDHSAFGACSKLQAKCRAPRLRRSDAKQDHCFVAEDQHIFCVWKHIVRGLGERVKKGPKDPNDGKRVAALTSTTIIINDNWVPEIRGGKCLPSGEIETCVGVKSMSMKIEAAIKLPKFASGKMSKTAKKEWDRFMVKLDSHEREHITITAKLAETMGKEIMKIEGVGLGDDETKAFKTAKADFIKRFLKTYGGKTISNRINAEHKSFDKRTGHGAKHGAKLNTSIT